MRGGSSRKASPLPKPTGPWRSSSEASPTKGPSPVGQLRERIAPTGVRTEGQALVHLLLLASLRGIAVRGPMAGGEQAYAHAEDWLGPPVPVDRDRALGELARRYLAGTRPPAIAISRNGPGSRWAPREPVCRRSPPSSTRGPTGWSS